ALASLMLCLFSCSSSAAAEVCTLSLHALFRSRKNGERVCLAAGADREVIAAGPDATRDDDNRDGSGGAASAGIRDGVGEILLAQDRKSTRLNSSHVKISYAVFCLKKKNTRSTD